MSKPEEQLASQLKAAHIKFEREYRPWKDRRFRFDFYVSIMQEIGVSYAGCFRQLLVEVQGGIWMPKFGKKSGHTTGVGINNNCEKYCLAAIDGYLVMPVTPDQIKSGKALQWIEKAMGRE